MRKIVFIVLAALVVPRMILPITRYEQAMKERVGLLRDKLQGALTPEQKKKIETELQAVEEKLQRIPWFERRQETGPSRSQFQQIPTLVPLADQRKRPSGWTKEDPNRIAALKNIRTDVTSAQFWASWDDSTTQTKRFIEDTCFLNSWAYSAACNPEITRIMNKAVEFASTPERYKELRDLIEKIRTSSQASIFFPAVAAADEALKQKEGAPATSLSPQDENAALKREIAALLARIKELERRPLMPPGVRPLPVSMPPFPESPFDKQRPPGHDIYPL